MICARDPDATLDILARTIAQADPIGLINLCAVALKPGPTTDKLLALRSLAAIINPNDEATVLRACADLLDFEKASTPSAEANTADTAPGGSVVVAPAEPPGATLTPEPAA